MLRLLVLAIFIALGAAARNGQALNGDHLAYGIAAALALAVVGGVIALIKWLAE